MCTGSMRALVKAAQPTPFEVFDPDELDVVRAAKALLHPFYALGAADVGSAAVDGDLPGEAVGIQHPGKEGDGGQLAPGRLMLRRALFV